jgi:hypothetical protein
MRRVLMPLAAAALIALPASPARAAESIAYCFHAWTDTADPGVSATPGETRFTSNGEKWKLRCQGTVRGHRVTGPGTFGEDGVIDGSCFAGQGEVNFSFTIPTEGGEQKFRLTFPFVYGPGGGTARTDDFPGVFVFYPTAGDCREKPVTRFEVVRNATLYS